MTEPVGGKKYIRKRPVHSIKENDKFCNLDLMYYNIIICVVEFRITRTVEQFHMF